MKPIEGPVLKFGCRAFYTCRQIKAASIQDVIDGKGEILTERKVENLILDTGLNGMAFTTGSLHGVPTVFTSCRIGDGTTPTKTASGAITFTQSGTTITASSSFFTAAMVGQLFKYGTGTGGAEQYIVSQTGTACVVSGAGMTVGTPTVATVWAVNQTALVNHLYSTITYQTSGTSCGTFDSIPVRNYRRTFVFPSQVSSYNVNEIGFDSSTSLAISTVKGRVVLPSTDVVSPSNFYVVQIDIFCTYSPSSPAASSNQGTGVNTAGTVMIETMDSFHKINSSGILSPAGYLDGGSGLNLRLITASYSQNSNIAASGFGVSTPSYFQSASFVTQTATGNRGEAVYFFNKEIFAGVNGETWYGIGLPSVGTNVAYDLKFTTPQTLPVGSAEITANALYLLYDRQLSN